MSAADGPVRAASPDEKRLAVANLWLLRAVREFGVPLDAVGAEVDRRRRAKGVSRHASMLEVLLDLRTGLWHP